MFKKLTGPRLVWRKVVVHIPQDGDGFLKASFRVQFEVKPRSEVDKLQEQFDAGDPNTDWLNQVVRDWKDYTDENNQAIEFSAQELSSMLDDSCARIALIQEYFNTANGGGGRRKNS